MFIDCAKLEKILKADYKTWGVKFGLTEKGMYILNGTGWMIEADKAKITKEFLGTVIKTCGLAPKKRRVHDIPERTRPTVRDQKRASPVGYGKGYEGSLYFTN